MLQWTKSSALQVMLHMLMSYASLLIWLLTLAPIIRDQISETFDVMLLCDHHCLFGSNVHFLFG